MCRSEMGEGVIPGSGHRHGFRRVSFRQPGLLRTSLAFLKSLSSLEVIWGVVHLRPFLPAKRIGSILFTPVGRRKRRRLPRPVAMRHDPALKQVIRLLCFYRARTSGPGRPAPLEEPGRWDAAVGPMRAWRRRGEDRRKTPIQEYPVTDGADGPFLADSCGRRPRSRRL